MAQNRPNPTVTLEDCKIVFRNFSGAEGKFNRKGDRNFCVLLDFDTAEAMVADGWNIKELQPRDEGDQPQPYLKVKVNFSGKPPRVHLVTSRNKTSLSEDMVDILDYAEIEKTDLIISPYDWNVNGSSGRSAYLKSIFVTIREDELDLKYADVPDSAMSSTLAIESGTNVWGGELEDMGEKPFHG